jgi:transcriptional regulator with XRE-family HTH domain
MSKISKWKENYPNFSETVKSKGLKLDYVAGSAGLTYHQLYRRLTNKRDFELPVMRKIANILGVSMDYLFNC